MRDHGGTISVASEVGQGATFAIVVPAAHAAPTAQSEQAAQAAQAASGANAVGTKASPVGVAC